MGNIYGKTKSGINKEGKARAGCLGWKQKWDNVFCRAADLPLARERTSFRK